MGVNMKNRIKKLWNKLICKKINDKKNNKIEQYISQSELENICQRELILQEECSTFLIQSLPLIDSSL